MVISLWPGGKAKINGGWHGGSPRPAPPHPAPKNSGFKIRWKSFRLDFLELRRNPPHWLSSKVPNNQPAVLLISTGAIEGHSEGKRRLREGHQSCLFLARQCSCSPATCNSEQTGLPGLWLSSSPTIFSVSGPVRLPPVPWTEKTVEISPFFFRRLSPCCSEDLVGRTN